MESICFWIIHDEAVSRVFWIPQNNFSVCGTAFGGSGLTSLFCALQRDPLLSGSDIALSDSVPITCEVGLPGRSSSYCYAYLDARLSSGIRVVRSMLSILRAEGLASRPLASINEGKEKASTISIGEHSQGSLLCDSTFLRSVITDRPLLPVIRGLDRV